METDDFKDCYGNSRMSFPDFTMQNMDSCCEQPIVQILSPEPENAPIVLDDCSCGADLVFAKCPDQMKPSPSPDVSHRTCWKQIDSNRILVIKEEEEPLPKISTKIIVKALIFLILLITFAVTVYQLSWIFPKSEEQLAVTLLLLFTIIIFRPKYFLPFTVMNIIPPKGVECETVYVGDYCEN